MNIQFDYVTGFVFLWTVVLGLIFCIAMFTLARLLQKAEREEDRLEFTEKFDKHETRLKAIEKLWIDSNRYEDIE